MNALVLEFLPIVRMAGRWLIKRLAEYGLPRVQAFIELRCASFRSRLKRARSKARKRWLRFRIAWRTAVTEWLDDNRKRLTARAIKVMDNAVEAGAERIPWDARGERFATYMRGR